MSKVNWGPIALAKFEGVAQSENSGKNFGARATLVSARQSDRPSEIQRTFNHSAVKKATPSPIQDSTQLSPEALELMNAMSK